MTAIRRLLAPVIARLRASWAACDTRAADYWASMGADDDPWPEWPEAVKRAETREHPPIPDTPPF